jgi:hypothetical protein
MRATLGGASAHGVLVHHAATHPDFRRRGLLAQAIEGLAGRTHESGASFAIAVVNQNSVETFVGTGGFTALRPLSVRLALGPLALRDAAEAPLDFAPQHDRAWLAWRLAASGAGYAIRRRGARVEIWGNSGLLGIPVLLGDASADAVEPHLPTSAPRSPLRLWVGRDAARRIAAPLAIELPLALRPSPLHLVFRPLAPGATTPRPDRLRFEALDFDAW